MALLALRFQLPIQLFRHGLGEVFCHGQINLKPIKSQRESLKTMEGHDVSEYWSQDFLIGQFFVDLDASTKQFSRLQETAAQLRFPVQDCRGNPTEHTGSLADTSYADRSDWNDFMVQNLFAHGQWTRQKTGKVKTTLHGTSWYSCTATQHWTFHDEARMATIEYMIHDVRLQIEELRMLSKFQWVASFTVTQCHMHCRGFTILSAAYLFSLKKQPGSHQLIFCEKWRTTWTASNSVKHICLDYLVHWADWTVGLWNLLTDTWLHVILPHHEFQHISRHQGLQWKCFRKLAQRKKKV